MALIVYVIVFAALAFATVEEFHWIEFLIAGILALPVALGLSLLIMLLNRAESWLLNKFK